MKNIYWSLLGGAALAAAASAAQADDLGTLKAQIEAMQSRVSELEAQSQASMPSGYSLLSIRDGQGVYEGIAPERSADRVREDSGFSLSVLPTADVVPAAEVSVSGEVRSALVYSDSNSDDSDDSLDVKLRGRLFIKGKADTAVGEVGGYFRLQADGGGDFSDYSESVKMNKAYGWWKFSPGWEFMAGYNDNTAALQVGWDWLAATGPVSSFGPSNINNEQLRLTYASGPLSFAIAVEDPDTGSTAAAVDSDGDGVVDDVETSSTDDKSDVPNVQAYAMYSSDGITGQIVGLYQSDDIGENSDFAIGGGATIALGDGLQVTAGAVFGEGTSSYANNISPLTADEEFWGGSVGVLANLADDTRLELGAGYESYDIAGTALGFGGGVYWDPVSQVTLGLGATYISRKDLQEYGITNNSELGYVEEEDQDSLEVFFGTWLRFP